MTEPVTLDPLELSDEEFAALQSPTDTTQGASQQSEETTNESEISTEDPIQSKEEPEADQETETEESGDKAGTVTGSDVSNPLSGDNGKASEETQTEKSPNSTEGESSDVPVVDYKAEYEKLLAPFKANGTDMQAQSVEDAIQLMQMGAGFHKKMAALKPAMKQVKLLEKHGLLDEDKLNYLIDLANKKPEAIQKLLKDSNIDPLDIDVKAESNYTPTQRRVSDTEIALDDVLTGIRETPTFQRTLNVVSKEWDESSQNTIATEPQIIATINGHMQDGTFDKVMQRVDYERNLGRLNGISDIQAYIQIGNMMADEGKLQRTGTPLKQAPTSIVQPLKAKPSTEEIERKQRKRAASPVKTSKTPAVGNLLDPLEMSDEDFAKLDIKKYLKS